MWSPTHVKDIIKLERVQRQASKIILKDYVSPYHERCTALSILPLCFRREIIDLCFYTATSMVNYSSNFELACPHNGLRSAEQSVLFKLPLFSSNVLIFIALLAYGTRFLLLSKMLVACIFLRRAWMWDGFLSCHQPRMTRDGGLRCWYSCVGSWLTAPPNSY